MHRFIAIPMNLTLLFKENDMKSSRENGNPCVYHDVDFSICKSFRIFTVSERGQTKTTCFVSALLLNSINTKDQQLSGSKSGREKEITSQ